MKNISLSDLPACSYPFAAWLKARHGIRAVALHRKETETFFKEYADLCNNDKMDKKYKPSVYELVDSESFNVIGRELNVSLAKPMKKKRDKNIILEDPVDIEEREEAERSKQRNRKRELQKHHRQVMDELVPKPETLKEKRRERNRQTSAYHKRDRNLEVELDDKELYGQGNELNTLLECKRKRNEAKMFERMEYESHLQIKRDQRMAKEKETMATLQRLARKGHQ